MTIQQLNSAISAAQSLGGSLELTCTSLAAILYPTEVRPSTWDPQVTTACIDLNDEILRWCANANVGKILEVIIVAKRSENGASSPL